MAIIPKAIALGSAAGAVGAVVIYGITSAPTGSGALVAAKANSLPAVPFPTSTTYLPCKPPAKLVKGVCVTKVPGPTIIKGVPAPVATNGFTPVATPKSSATSPQTTSSGSAVGGDDDGDDHGGDD